MVGDAPGDWNAAKANGVLFYPIDPGYEDESWQRFFEEALPRFFAGHLCRRLHGCTARPVRDAAPRTAAVERGVECPAYRWAIEVRESCTDSTAIERA